MAAVASAMETVFQEERQRVEEAERMSSLKTKEDEEIEKASSSSLLHGGS